MNLYLFVKYMHVLAAIWFIAGIIGRQLVRSQAQRSENIAQFAKLTQVAGQFESLMVIPGNLLVIVLGVLLAWMGGWPIFGFLQGAEKNWLLITNLILAGGLLVVPLVYIPRGKVFGQRLKEALAIGRMTPDLELTLRDPVMKWAHRGEAVGLVVILALMVLKPF